tara:strand:+ start:87 stop:218 length:132 start_codon:yes stop_codon:yes gene_type:complete
MRIICVLFMAVVLTNCSAMEKKVDKWYWDPVKGMFRITFGKIK